MRNDFTTHSMGAKSDASDMFQERSELAQEIINSKPSFFDKWALVYLLVLLALLFSCTWFIKYPEIIVGRAVLSAENAPKEIVPIHSGRIVSLFFGNNELVKQGDIIAWLESNANTSEVIDLSGRLKTGIEIMAETNPTKASEIFSQHYKNLGELQISYQTFITAWQQYNDYLVNGFYLRKMTMLVNDIGSLQMIKEKNSDQKTLLKDETDVSRKTLEMNELLYKEKVISKEEYRQAQLIFINKLKEGPQIDMSIINQETLIREKQKEIDQLKHDLLQQKHIFELSLQTLKNDVDDWLRKFTIQSPSDGQLAYIKPLQKNQRVEQDKLIAYVNPPNNEYYAEVWLPQTNIGKIDSGMSVQLRFAAYPYQEVGFVSGNLNYISKVAIDSGFWGKVGLQQKLVTSQNKTIQYKSGLKADALVITKDLRLIQRFYANILRSVSLN